MKPSERKSIEIALRNAEEVVERLKQVLKLNPKPDKIVVSQKFSPWDMHCAEYLNKALQVNIRNYKSKSDETLEKWADEFRLMRTGDGYTEQEIGEVLQWAVRDEFWKTVILSASKFRAKYDTLIARMSSTNGAPNLE